MLTDTAIVFPKKLDAGMYCSLYLLLMIYSQFALSHPFLRAGTPEESSEGKVIHRKGRFQVTSDNMSQKVLI
jgi:hypothetical protein